MLTKIDILRFVAVRLGEEPPTSINDDTDFMEAANAVYDGIVDDCFTKHAWTFAEEVRSFQKSSIAPVWPYEYTYVLPADDTTICWVNNGKYDITAYLIQGDKLYSFDEGPLNIALKVRRTEASWPADFRMAVALMLEATLWKGFADDRIASESCMDEAIMKMLAAIRRDKRQVTQRRAHRTPALNAWYGRKGRGSDLGQR